MYIAFIKVVKSHSYGEKKKNRLSRNILFLLSRKMEKVYKILTCWKFIGNFRPKSKKVPTSLLILLKAFKFRLEDFITTDSKTDDSKTDNSKTDLKTAARSTGLYEIDYCDYAK